MTRQWTPEGLERRREATRRTKPWEHSTGPKTPEGKARSSQNSLRHGYWSREAIAARRAMTDLIDRLDAVP